MSEKILSPLNQDCKDFFQAGSSALQLSRSIAAELSEIVPPLRRRPADWPIGYESAIALKVAARQSRSRSAEGTVSPAALAAEIAAASSIAGWQIQASPSGLLRFHADEPTIAANLQRWLIVHPGCTAELHATQSLPIDQLFRVQYVHARCWMLLRSAAREGWFTPFDLPPDLPWLTSTGKLRLQHTVERQAIGALFDAVDALAREQTGDRLWKQAASLSHQLDAFQSACRVWGEVKTQDLPLAQARLGLTWAGQVVLQVLLNHLGLDAPRSL